MTKKKSTAAALDAIDFETLPPETPVQPSEEAPAPMTAAPAVEAPAAPGATIFLNVRGCSACGADHDGVIMFNLPDHERTDRLYTHYFNCPTKAVKVQVQYVTGG